MPGLLRPNHAGTGIERDRVGDVIIQGDQGAQIICAPNVVVHLEATLTQAGAAAGCQAWAGVLEAELAQACC